VWDPPRRAAVATALQRPDLSYAADTAAHVEGILGDYAARLVATHVATCEATRVRGERSEAMLDLSMTCLDRRTAELAALVDEFTRADDDVRERAVAAARHLSDPSGCADVGRLALPVAPPADPDGRAEVREIEHGLDVLTAQRLTGRYREAQAQIGALVDRARAVNHLPTLAEALALQATLLADTGDVDAAITVGHEATYAAEAGHHDEALARVRTRLVHWLGYAATREAEALAMARQAQATIERLGGDPVLAADLARELPSVKQAAGDWEDSHRLALDALARIEAAYGPDAPDTADALHNLGVTEQTLGRPADALPRHDRSIAIWTAAFGPDHPEVAFGYSARANALGSLGRLDEALAGQLRVRAIWEGAFGREHPRVAATINNIGVYQMQLGKLAEARETLTRGVALWQRLEPEGPRMSEILTSMGQIHHAEGDHAGALAAHRRAHAIAEKIEGEGGATAARHAANIGFELLELGRAAEAVPLFTRARAALTAAVGPRDPMLVQLLDGLGEAHARTGDRAAAAECYREELAILSAGAPDPAAVARVEGLLARLQSAH
jgi:tetratricopeptide (TPR) repeat protein